MKRYKGLLVFVLMFVSFLFLAPANAEAATIGQQLTSPEDGWQRIDDSNQNIIYSGIWRKDIASGAYNGDNATSLDPTSTIKFNFRGSKLRIIANTSSKYRPTNINVNIDGINESFTETYANNSTFLVLCYEKVGLDFKDHTVIISSNQLRNDIELNFDAIDIDSTGYLIGKNLISPSNLVAVPSDSKVTLSWDAVAGATSYNIKRSDIQGGPYTTITTDTKTTIIDTGLTNGKTYYYVVSAVNAEGESVNSVEVSAVPFKNDSYGNGAILEVVMTNNSIKEYDLTAIELNDFLSWYDKRSDGIGKSYFKMPKKSNIKPFKARYEYLSFEKIYSFEIKEYNE